MPTWEGSKRYACPGLALVEERGCISSFFSYQSTSAGTFIPWRLEIPGRIDRSVHMDSVRLRLIASWFVPWLRLRGKCGRILLGGRSLLHKKEVRVWLSFSHLGSWLYDEGKGTGEMMEKKERKKEKKRLRTVDEHESCFERMMNDGLKPLCPFSSWCHT